MSTLDSYEVFFLKEEEKQINKLISLYKEKKLTPEEAKIGIGVIDGIRSLAKRIDKQILGGKEYGGK